MLLLTTLSKTAVTLLTTASLLQPVLPATEPTPADFLQDAASRSSEPAFTTPDSPATVNVLDMSTPLVDDRAAVAAEEAAAKKAAEEAAAEAAAAAAKKAEEEQALRQFATVDSAQSIPTYDANMVAATGKQKVLVDAALAQVGVSQDCTMLVTNSLRAIGINFHDWPAGYASLGTITTDPQPGDIAIQTNGGSGLGHVSIYIGNGQAVHGGWTGNTTVVSQFAGSQPYFIRLR